MTGCPEARRLADIFERQALFRLGVEAQRARAAHEIFRKSPDLCIGANEPHQRFLVDVTTQ